MDFEKSLKSLEDIVRQLEDGELTLEKSIELFEKGIILSRDCSKILDKAEQKVNILVKDKDGELLEQPFESNLD